MSPTAVRRAGLLLAAVLLTCSGCGGTTATNNPADPSPGPTQAGPDAPGGPGSAIVVLRTGGFAGVFDRLLVDSSGAARITSRSSASHACTPSAKSLERLRAVDLSVLTSPPTKPPRIADAFHYSVQVGGVTAQASDGDSSGRRADLLGAAAGVLASCLANQGHSAVTGSSPASR